MNKTSASHHQLLLTWQYISLSSVGYIWADTKMLQTWSHRDRIGVICDPVKYRTVSPYWQQIFKNKFKWWFLIMFLNIHDKTKILLLNYSILLSSRNFIVCYIQDYVNGVNYSNDFWYMIVNKKNRFHVIFGVY